MGDERLQGNRCPNPLHRGMEVKGCTEGVTLENIKVSAKTHTFDAKNSKNVTVNGKKYKKIDEKGITLDF